MYSNDKRGSILRATVTEVAMHGFHGTPIEHIAERAGVAKGTIYCYFKNKDDLIKQVYRYLEKQVLIALMSHFPEKAPAQDRFMYAAEVMTRYWIGCPLEFRFLEQFHNSPYGMTYRRERLFESDDRNILTEFFNEAREAGIIKDLPVPLLFAIAFGPLINICRDQIFDIIELDDSMISRCVEACWDAIAIQ